jgi:FAD dependent oxidoreductase
MEDRGSIPPGLPRPKPTISYWQDPPDEIADLRSTVDLPNVADIVVIGSGISGSCISNMLLQALPGSKVVMLEARQAASGASGRNGRS